MTFEFILHGTSVHFFNRTVFGSNTWFWDFGDGNTSTLREPSHVYAGGGTYPVTLTATCGTRESSVTKNVVIDIPGSPLMANYSYATYHNGDTIYLGSIPSSSTSPIYIYVQLDGSSQNRVGGVTIINEAMVSSVEFRDGNSDLVSFPFIVSTSYPNNVLALSFVPDVSGPSGLVNFIFDNTGGQFVLNVTWDVSP